MSLKDEVIFFSVSTALSRKVRAWWFQRLTHVIFDVLEAWYLEACRPCTRWYVEWYKKHTFPCYHENTTRVVFFVPIPVVFYVAHIILDHDVNFVESHPNWYKTHHNQRYHSGGIGGGIYQLRIPSVIRNIIVQALPSKLKYHSIPMI